MACRAPCVQFFRVVCLACPWAIRTQVATLNFVREFIICCVRRKCSFVVRRNFELILPDVVSPFSMTFDTCIIFFNIVYFSAQYIFFFFRDGNGNVQWCDAADTSWSASWSLCSSQYFSCYSQRNTIVFQTSSSSPSLSCSADGPSHNEGTSTGVFIFMYYLFVHTLFTINYCYLILFVSMCWPIENYMNNIFLTLFFKGALYVSWVSEGCTKLERDQSVHVRWHVSGCTHRKAQGTRSWCLLTTQHWLGSCFYSRRLSRWKWRSGQKCNNEVRRKKNVLNVLQ